MADKIQDYCSGAMVEGTPEEIEAVQPLAKSLVEDYGYPIECVVTHPQHRVKARPSDRKKEYPVDISVFSDVAKKDSDLYIIGECKKQTRKDGQDQLEDYMRLSRAKFGVWFNGKERLFIRKIEHDGVVEFEPIPNLPKYGQRVEDIGKFVRGDLKPTHNLKNIFKAIRNYLAGNAIGVTKDDTLAQQLINLIFCKIYDEKFTANDKICRFRAGFGEDPEKVKARILKIFEDVKVKYKDVIETNDEIILDAASIVYVVGELQDYCLMTTERDVVADAFEIFIDHAIKGGQGQFFTPRNVIKMIVEIMDPDEDDTMIDTCCGSGGFPIETMRYVWDKIEKARHVLNWSDAEINEDKKDYAMSKLCGLEKDAFLTKITKAYMAILGDGKSGIFCEDSLDIPDNWKPETKVKIHMNSFSMLMTNPPFGKDIDVVGKEKLEQYEFGYKWNKDCERTSTLKTKENPQILFLERDLQMLKDGGKMAVILPETYLHAPSVKYVINHLAEHNNIFAVVDLPHNTFRPHCNAKCVVLFIEKGQSQQEEITMGIVEEMGHNHQGKPIYRFDYDTKTVTEEIWDDTEIVAQEFKNPKNPDNKLVFTVHKDDIVNNIYVPRYYWDKRVKDLQVMANNDGCDLVSMQTLLDEGIIKVFKGHGSPPSEYKGTGDVFYVRAGDIMDWDIFKNPTSSVPYDIYAKCVKGKVELQTLDICFVKEGSYRVGDVAMLSPYDTDILLNHHTLVFRVVNPQNKYGIDAYYLLYLLSHHLVKMQHFNKIMIDTTLPNIGDRWKELLLPVLRDSAKKDKIKSDLADAFDAKWSTQQRLIDIRTAE